MSVIVLRCIKAPKMTEKLTLESLPEAVGQLNQKLESIQNLLLERGGQRPEKPIDEWLSLNDLVQYDPAKRAKATWYSIVSRNDVPHHKNGKHLIFLKSEIDHWLKAGRRKSNSEIEKEAEVYLKRKGGKNV